MDGCTCVTMWIWSSTPLILKQTPDEFLCRAVGVESGDQGDARAIDVQPVALNAAFGHVQLRVFTPIPRELVHYPP